MKAEIKTRWLEALRSGRFPQTKGVLERTSRGIADELGNADEVGFCCLGVLCSLAVEDGVIQRKEGVGGVALYGDGEGHSEAELPDAVVRWAGLDSTDPEVVDPARDRTYSLAAINDTGGSFEHIAGLIEAQY